MRTPATNSPNPHWAASYAAFILWRVAPGPNADGCRELTYAGSVVGGTKDELRGSIVARADVGHVRLPTDQLLSTENTFETHHYYLKHKNMT